MAAQSQDHIAKVFPTLAIRKRAFYVDITVDNVATLCTHAEKLCIINERKLWCPDPLGRFIRVEDMIMTARTEFVGRFHKMLEEDGLCDIKFMVKDGRSMSEDRFFEAAVEFDDAAKNGRPVDLQDIDVEPEPSRLLTE